MPITYDPLAYPNSPPGGNRDPFSVASADGAITQRIATVFITKTSAAALTIADPGADDDGKELLVMATTAYAHTLDNSAGSGFNAGGGASDVATFDGNKGSNLQLVAYGGKWYVADKTGVTLG